MLKRGAFDYILLETTGLADPGNIAPLFWVDDGLGSSIYLDGIVTLVDAKNILRSLDDPTGDVGHREHQDAHGPLLTTAHLQISHADIVVINKSDLVSQEELNEVEARIFSINGLAKIHITERGVVPNLDGFLLDLHAYDQVNLEEIHVKGHSHLDPVSFCAIQNAKWKEWLINQTISTLTIPVAPLETTRLELLDRWLRAVLWDHAVPGDKHAPRFEVHRSKGRFIFRDGTVKMLQGVRETFELIDAPDGATTDRPAEGKIVLIGRLRGIDFETSFRHAMS